MGMNDYFKMDGQFHWKNIIACKMCHDGRRCALHHHHLDSEIGKIGQTGLNREN